MAGRGRARSGTGRFGAVRSALLCCLLGVLCAIGTLAPAAPAIADAPTAGPTDASVGAGLSEVVARAAAEPVASVFQRACSDAVHKAMPRARAAARPREPQVSWDDVAWHVDYRDGYWGQARAPEDGSVAKWARNYFMVHKWSEDGQRVLAHVSPIEVDGKIYVFQTSFVVDRWDTELTMRQEAIRHGYSSSWVMFQTCLDDTYREVVCYRLANL